MGALISAPISAGATCLGGCGAILCGKCLESGTISSNKAAHILLLWLQVFAAVLSLLASTNPEHWLGAPCEQLGTVGVCVCHLDSDPATCFSSQVAYRVTAAVVALFVLLVLLACSGCVQGAAKSYVVLRFFVVLLLGFVFLFVPNSVFDVFGEVAGATSAIFLGAQAVLVIDLAYTWNESWYTKAVMARRARPGSGVAQTWEGLILAASALLLTLSLAAVVVLFVSLGSETTTAVLVPTMVVGFALLLASITSWCKNGALLTSSVMVAYSIWLVVEALAAAPASDLGRPSWLRVVEIVACALTLVGLASGVASARAVSAQPPAADSDRAEARLEAGSSEAPLHGGLFAAHCAVHAAAAMYIGAAVAAPAMSGVVFGFRVMALALALLLYAWSLVAPQVLTNRTF